MRRKGPVYRLTPELRQALGGLEARDREFLKRRYLRGQKLKEIAAFFGITTPRVRVIVNRAEKRLALAYAAAVRREAAERPPRRWITARRLVIPRRPEPFGTLDEILDALGALPGPTRDEILDEAVRASGRLYAADPRVIEIILAEGGAGIERDEIVRNLMP